HKFRLVVRSWRPAWLSILKPGIRNHGERMFSQFLCEFLLLNLFFSLCYPCGSAQIIHALRRFTHMNLLPKIVSRFMSVRDTHIGIDAYDPITTRPTWKLETNHPLLLTAGLHNQEQAAPRSQRVNRIPGFRPASRKISELCGNFWHVGSLS